MHAPFFRCKAIFKTFNLTDSQVASLSLRQLAFLTFAAYCRPLIKKLILQNITYFYQGVQN